MPHGNLLPQRSQFKILFYLLCIGTPLCIFCPLTKPNKSADLSLTFLLLEHSFQPAVAGSTSLKSNKINPIFAKNAFNLPVQCPSEVDMHGIILAVGKPGTEMKLLGPRPSGKSVPVLVLDGRNPGPQPWMWTLGQHNFTIPFLRFTSYRRCERVGKLSNQSKNKIRLSKPNKIKKVYLSDATMRSHLPFSASLFALSSFPLSVTFLSLPFPSPSPP